jgi:hypothetical protein
MGDSHCEQPNILRVFACYYQEKTDVFCAAPSGIRALVDPSQRKHPARLSRAEHIFGEWRFVYESQYAFKGFFRDGERHVI